MAVWGVAIIGNLFVNTPTVPIEFKLTPPEPSPVIEIIKVAEAKEETIEEKIKRISQEYEIDVLLLYSIVEAESQFQNVCNTKGCRYGIGPAQIVQSTFDEQCEGDINNVDDNLTCAAKLLNKGDYWRWEQSWNKWLPKIDSKLAYKIRTLCSCMWGLRAMGINLKGNATDLIPNSTPTIGGVVKLIYNRIGHAAKITKFTKDGMLVRETNYKKCAWTTREIAFNDPAIAGFLIP